MSALSSQKKSHCSARRFRPERLERRLFLSAGDFDLTFNATGKLLCGTLSSAADVVALGDGSALMAATRTVTATNTDFVVAKTTPAGAYDPSFGNWGGTGMCQIEFPDGSTDTATALAVQPDGKIVVAGTRKVGETDHDFVLARILADGSGYDPQFVTWDQGGSSYAGRTYFDFNDNDDYVSDVALQPDGKIVVVGTTTDSSGNSDFAAVRFNADGTLDTTFGTAGSVQIDFGWYDSANAVVTLPITGQVILGGAADVQSGQFPLDFGLACLDAYGSLDTTFGSAGTGKATFNAGADETITDLLIDQTGEQIIFAGNRANYGAEAHDVIVAAVSTTGTPPLEWQHTFDFNEIEHSPSLALRLDGQIFVGMNVYTNVQNDIAIAQIGPDGFIDTSFATDGSRIIDFGSNSDDQIASVGVDPVDGRAYVVGTIEDNSGRHAGVMRIRDRLDTKLAGRGLATFDLATNDRGTGVLVRPDGTTLVTGYTGTTPLSDEDFLVRAIGIDGTPDAGFGVAGVATMDFGAGDLCNASILQPDGKTLLVGQSNVNGPFTFAIARFNANGTPDTGFDGDGKLLVDFGATLSGVAYGVAIRPDGRIVVGGYSYATGAPTVRDFTLVQLTPAGALDTSFGGGDGILILDDYTQGEACYDIALSPDGTRVYMVGTTGTNSTADVAVACVAGDGVLDTLFGGGDGHVEFNLNQRDEARAVAVDPAGRIFIGATGGLSTDSTDPYLLRLSDTGSLEYSTAVLDPSNTQTTLYDLDLDPAGRVVIGGISQSQSERNLFIARRTAGGLETDYSFGPFGRQIYDLNPADVGYAVDASGPIVVAGYTGTSSPAPGAYDAFVMRFNVPPALLATPTFVFDSPALKHRLWMQFNDDVGATLDSADFEVLNLTTGQTIAPDKYTTAFSTVADSVEIVFSGVTGWVDGILPNGDYRLTVKTSVTNSNGATLSAPYTFDFFFLSGDANRDRKVDIGDFSILAANFNLPGTFTDADFNYDGMVGISDFAMLALRFNTQLAGGDGVACAAFPRLPAAVPAERRSMFSTEPVIDLLEI